MRLTFLGAAREVTGSCYYLEISDCKILVDCGMEQGPDLYENQELPVPASEVDLVLLTHAHIDHSGLIPLLYRKGFRGTVYMTSASKELCEIMLLDSAHIQEFEADQNNKKSNKNSATYYVPMYTQEDVVGVVNHFVAIDYEKPTKIWDGITVTYYDAGHLLGSASIEILAEEDGKKRTLVFSGDIGNRNKPIIKDPTLLTSADYVIMESTYGDRSHNHVNNYEEQLFNILTEAFDRGGEVIIPSFAVGRMQELLYFLRLLKEDPRMKKYRNFKVYVDSPLAIRATHIFKKNYVDFFDDETKALIAQGINPLEFSNLKMSLSAEDSKNIYLERGHKVIIAASGMCEAGRIRHHLKYYLSKENSTIVFVGYQVPGTLGRIILDGATSVKLFGETVPINAKITQMEGTSSHADINDLLSWASSFNPKPTRFFITHGVEEVAVSFAEELALSQHQFVSIPYNGAIWDLISDESIFEGNKQVKRRTDRQSRKRYQIKMSGVYGKLLDALEKLETSVKKNQGLENRELRKFTNEIESLAKKWDRDI